MGAKETEGRKVGRRKGFVCGGRECRGEEGRGEERRGLWVGGCWREGGTGQDGMVELGDF